MNLTGKVKISEILNNAANLTISSAVDKRPMIDKMVAKSLPCSMTAYTRRIKQTEIQERLDISSMKASLISEEGLTNDCYSSNNDRDSERKAIPYIAAIKRLLFGRFKI